MKRFLAGVVCVLCCGVVHGADVTVELRGVLEESSGPRLSLFDPTNQNARWVGLGESFAGYRVENYDAAKGTATLEKDGAQIQVRLASAAVPPLVELSSATVEAIRANLRRIARAADRYFDESSRGEVSVRELLESGEYLTSLAPLDGEDYLALKFKRADFQQELESLSIVTRGQVVVKAEFPLDEPFSQKEFPRTHTVSAGDTAAKIAKLYGRSVSDLQALNPDVQWSRLKVRQTLKVR